MDRPPKLPGFGSNRQACRAAERQDHRPRVEHIHNPVNRMNKSVGATLAVARTAHTRPAW